jgi:hypothetical protein
MVQKINSQHPYMKFLLPLETQNTANKSNANVNYQMQPTAVYTEIYDDFSIKDAMLQISLKRKSNKRL